MKGQKKRKIKGGKKEFGEGVDQKNCGGREQWVKIHPSEKKQREESLKAKQKERPERWLGIKIERVPFGAIEYNY